MRWTVYCVNLQGTGSSTSRENACAAVAAPSGSSAAVPVRAGTGAGMLRGHCPQGTCKST